MNDQTEPPIKEAGRSAAADATLPGMAQTYRRTVNMAQAPPWLVPLPFVLAGLTALAVAGVRLVTLRHALALGAWGLPSLVLTGHVVTLGFLTLNHDGPPVPVGARGV